MAKKTFCDACGEVVNPHIGTPLQIPLHVTEPFPSYTDMAGNGTSGRHVTQDLCLLCSNEIYAAAYAKIIAIRARPKPNPKNKINADRLEITIDISEELK